ncbi:MAG TPA: NAD(P)-dependent oxidoreductase [Hyphomicrobiaceae bacterium]|nr:NAD(P)-dependent oxidoreductase [Hyphomicrobiaceae bacterium]
MTRPIIGFIGLGLMGHGFVKRLLSTGHQVIAYDIAADKIAVAEALGAAPAASPADVAQRSDIVCVCVTTPADVTAIVTGPSGLTSAGRLDGKVFVDHSTTDIDTTRELAQALQTATGMAFVDAPVSGGPGAAEAGCLAIMGGGDAAAIAKVAPIMDHLGSFTHMGPVTAGQATKLVNQTLVLNNYCVIAEALRLAEAYGIDAAKIPAALAGGHAGSNLLPVLFERMIARDWTPLGYGRQVLKDLEMLNTAAKAEHVAMPMSAQALTLYRMLITKGHGEKDGSAIFTLLDNDAPRER